jgi:AcrR family transcriptional regulator
MPKVVDQTERRAEVAAAARAVIAREGLEGASVRRVAAEAGSSTTVVTHYFADKDALLLAAVEDAYAAVAARVLAKSESGLTGLSGLRMILLEALPLDAERRAEARVWIAFWAAATTRKQLRPIQTNGYRVWRDVVSRMLLEAEARGEIRPGLDLVREGEQLMCLVDGLLLQSTLEPRRLTADRQVEILDAALDRLR